VLGVVLCQPSAATETVGAARGAELACTSLPAKRRVSVTVTLPCSCAARTDAAVLAAASAASAAALAASDAPVTPCTEMHCCAKLQTNPAGSGQSLALGSARLRYSAVHMRPDNTGDVVRYLWLSDKTQLTTLLATADGAFFDIPSAAIHACADIAYESVRVQQCKAAHPGVDANFRTICARFPLSSRSVWGNGRRSV